MECSSESAQIAQQCDSCKISCAGPYMVTDFYRTVVFQIYCTRPCTKKSKFLNSQPKHMLRVLKRTVSMGWVFRAPKTYVKSDGSENIYNFTLSIVLI